ncbi:MAG: aldo/keto reductase [Planctomycetes bacterium]|nr:aldo/keto reductase [Planctomycetota bacterium]
MEHRRLGSTDIDVSVITFGAWAIGGWMWGGQEEKDAIAAIHAALDHGVTSIDTAAVYGFGDSERLVRKAVGKRRHEVRIFTKFGLRWDRDEGEVRFETFDNDGRPVKVRRNARPDSVIEECDNSLRRLGTDYIDLFQIHWPDPQTPVEETMAALDRLLQAGKILAAGVSNYSVEDLDRARRTCPIASSQPPYSMVLRGAEKDMLPYCREHTIGVVVYSPLQRGLLTGKVTADREFPEDDHRRTNPLFSVENRRRVNAFLDEIRPVAEAHDVTLAQLAINWTIHRPGITAALVGSRNARQAAENAQAASFKLRPDETAFINERLERLELLP